MKQEMMGWQWHQLDHMQIICTTLQTANHASTPSLNFLRAGCSSCCPTNSIKALKTNVFALFEPDPSDPHTVCSQHRHTQREKCLPSSRHHAATGPPVWMTVGLPVTTLPDDTIHNQLETMRSLYTGVVLGQHHSLA